MYDMAVGKKVQRSTLLFFFFFFSFFPCLELQLLSSRCNGGQYSVQVLRFEGLGQFFRCLLLLVHGVEHPHIGRGRELSDTQTTRPPENKKAEVGDRDGRWEKNASYTTSSILCRPRQNSFLRTIAWTHSTAPLPALRCNAVDPFPGAATISDARASSSKRTHSV